MIRVALFELGSRLGDRSFYLISGLLFVHWFAASLRLGYDPNLWGPYGEVNYNAPVVLYTLLAGQCFVVLACAPVFLGNALLRDLEQRTAEVLYALPIPAGALFWGRFWGSFAAFLLCALLSSSAIVLAPLASAVLGMVERGRVTGMPVAHLLQAWATLLAPTVFVAASAVYAIAALTRRQAAVLASTVVLVLVAAVAHQLGRQVSGLALQIADVTGADALYRATQYWTVEQRNTSFLPLAGPLLANRLVWLGLASALLGFAARRFSAHAFLFGHGAPESVRERLEAAAPLALAGGARALPPRRLSASEVLVHQCRWELGQIFREPLLLVVLGLCFVWAAAQNLAALHLGFERILPETWKMADARRGLWMLTFMTVPFTAVGVLFRERSARMAEITDAAPVPDAVLYGGKLLALAVFTATLPLLVGLAGIGTQLAYGFWALDAGRYTQELVASYYPYLLQLGLFAAGLGVYLDSRAKSFGLVMLLLYASVFAHESGLVDHPLLLQLYEQRAPHSGFTQPAAQLARVFAYQAYWLSIAGLVALGGALCWPRGVPAGVRWRLARARARCTAPVAVLAAALLAVAGGTATWIQRSESAPGGYRSAEQVLAAAAEYERRYRDRDPQPPPAVEHAELRIALYPEERRAELQAELELRNAAAVALRELPVELPEHATGLSLWVGGKPLALLEDDPELRHQRYRLPRPLAPGERIALGLRVEARERGFGGRVEGAPRLGPGGVWLPGALLPRLGYDRSREVEVPRERARLGLPGRAPALWTETDSAARPLQVAGPAAALWEIEVETRADHAALAPGRLQSEYLEGARRRVRFRAERAEALELVIVSAPYEPESGGWTPPGGSGAGGSGAVALQVFALPEHRANAVHFVEGARRALAFLSARLGPYPYTDLRIAEVPRGARLLSSAANLVLVPEDEGWNGDYRGGRPADLPEYAVARQLAAHWWSNGLRPPALRGRGVLTAGIPEYLALRAVESDFGESALRGKYLPRALRRYFWYHGRNGHHELPLLESDGNFYVDELKAALTLRALALRIGPGELDARLAAYLRESDSGSGASARGLRDALAASARAAGAGAFADEVFADVVHYDNRLLGAQVRRSSGGGHSVEVVLDARRVDATPAVGASDEASGPDVFPLEIGVSVRAASEQPPALHIETVQVRSGRQTLELRVEGEPIAVELDPRGLLLDPERANNAIHELAPRPS